MARLAPGRGRGGAANAAAVSWVPTPDDEAELDEIFPTVPRVALF